MKPYLYKIAKQENLAKFLSRTLSISGKKARKMLETNFCKVNGKIERFGSSFLKKGDFLEILEKKEEIPFSLEIQTLYEDEEIKIVDKPPNFVSSQENISKCLGQNLFLVHRLDKDTTGVLILAKSKRVKESLILLFKEKKIHKKYIALVDGIVRKEEGVIETFLTKKRFFQGQTVWGSSGTGLAAITKWKFLGKGEKSSLVEVEPITGRTHQIRVHMKEMGHPILVDSQYSSHFQSNYFSSRYLLHSFSVSFTYLGKKIEAQSPLPLDMQKAVQNLHIIPKMIQESAF